MSRRHLAPDIDFVCRRCGCICDPDWIAEPKHRGGGPGMKSCGKTPMPALRSQVEEESAAVVRYIRERKNPL